MIATVLDETKAACELAWGHFFPATTMPRAVELLGRYDVWDHLGEGVLPFQYGMRQYDTDPAFGTNKSIWRELFYDYTGSNIKPGLLLLNECIAAGSTILHYQRKQDAELVEHNWFPVTFAGHRWQACNRLGKGSQFFDSVWDPLHFDGVLSFGWTGQRWQVGLYSTKPDVDCGAIAKRFGGGGHPGAAGFMRPETPEFVDSVGRCLLAMDRGLLAMDAIQVGEV